MFKLKHLQFCKNSICCDTVKISNKATKWNVWWNCFLNFRHARSDLCHPRVTALKYQHWINSSRDVMLFLALSSGSHFGCFSMAFTTVQEKFWTVQILLGSIKTSVYKKVSTMLPHHEGITRRRKGKGNFPCQCNIHILNSCCLTV